MQKIGSLRFTKSRLAAFPRRLGRDIISNRLIYIMILPAVLYYVIFRYFPMYGLIIAFKDFKVTRGFAASDWVGFKHFIDFFNGYTFARIIRNTFSISIMYILIGFPVPIIFALLLNEITNSGFKRSIQSITYMPHFISIVVICGIIVDFSLRDGVFNDVLNFFIGRRISILQEPALFQPLYVLSSVWQEFGWGSIIYLAALCNIDPQLYEAATIDGAGRWRKMINITLPGLMPTIVILFILRIGNIMQLGFEKIILLYNPSIYETADVISTYVYRKGLIEFDFSFATAVGLFNTIINFLFLLSANWIARRVNETSLW